MRRLVLSRPDRLGDVIITSSLLPSLRAALPETEIYWIAAEPYRCLFAGHPCLNGFFNGEEAGEALLRLKPEAIIHFHPNAALAQAALTALIPGRIGYRERGSDSWLTHAVEDHRAEGLCHEAAYAAALLNPLELALLPSKPCLHLASDSLARLQAKLSWDLASTNYAVLNPTAHSKTLRWPWRRFFDVGRNLASAHHLLPVLIGSPADDPDGLALHQAWQEAGLVHENLLGRLALDELAQLLRHARLLISRNTGPSHLAAAMDCPQIEIFGRYTGPYSVTRWQAQSELSQRLVPDLEPQWWEPKQRYWSRCAQAISVAQVNQAVAHLL
jgi:ADP-heptose:LPS heptosyltransferase